MAGRLFNFLYGHEPASFESDFTLAESVRRLRAATIRSVFFSLHKQSASGTVNERKVSLQRVIPMVGNSFKPFFIGAFEVVNGRVVLVGRFTMTWVTKAFMTIWFGFILLWTVLAAGSIIAQAEPNHWWFPFFGLGMAIAGIVLIKVGKWFSRNDTEWLSRCIQGALSADVPSSCTPAPGHDFADAIV